MATLLKSFVVSSSLFFPLSLFYNFLVRPIPSGGILALLTSHSIRQIENTNDPRNRDPAAPDLDLPEDFDIDDDDDSSAQDSHRGHAATFVRIEGPNFSYTSTQRNFGPRAQFRTRPTEAGGEGGHEHPDDMMVHLFTTMLRNIMGDPSVVEGAGTPGESPRAGGGLGAGQTTGSPTGSPHAHTPLSSIFGPPPPVFRFPHDPSTRLNPRDADSPQPHDENFVELPTYVL